ncbi:hypothetical protein MKW98_006201 [Papaver atlanticum]|uniref:Uncharacterized protein n=1 Tax=Papaver atlanticum TaxID=357466 RepID=A0AAD4TH57_9MAGN|nr:hypothetical protein MKW98_006201 [Papaver atlanticum]
MRLKCFVLMDGLRISVALLVDSLERGLSSLQMQILMRSPLFLLMVQSLLVLTR